MKTFIILGILLSLGKLVSFISNKIKLPAVTGMIALGIILGPTVFGLIRQDNLTPEYVYKTLHYQHKKHEDIETLMEVFPRQMSFEIVHFLALIGVTMLLFSAGLETDIAILRRAGRVSLLVALGGLILPFLLGFGLSLLFTPDNFQRALIIGTILTATSVSVSAMSLMALKKIQSREGTTIITSAIIDDVIGIIILSVVLAVLSGNINEFVRSILYMSMFLVLAVLFGWFIVPFIMNASKKMNVTMGVNAIALSLMLFFAGLAEASHVAGITGAYLAGLFISRTSYKNAVRESVETIGHSFFIPLFFIFIGLQVNLRIGTYNWLFISLFVLAAIVGKVIGSGGMAWFSGFSPRNAFAVGSGMVPRGEVALVIASIGLNYSNIIDTSTFTATVILVIISSFITPFLLVRGFSQKEN